MVRSFPPCSATRASLDTGLSPTGSCIYIHTKIIEGPADTVGNFVSSVPQNMASLRADHTLPEDGAGSGLGIRARVIGSSFGSDTNPTRNAAHVLFDAAVSHDSADLDRTYEG